MTASMYYCDIVPGATVSATSSATNYPVANVKDQFAVNRWRSTAKTAPQYVQVTLGSLFQSSAVWVVNHNVTIASGGAIQLQMSNVSNFSTSVTYDMTIIEQERVSCAAAGASTYNYRYAYYIPAAAYRYYRIIFAATGITDSYYECGEVCIFSGAVNFGIKRDSTLKDVPIHVTNFSAFGRGQISHRNFIYEGEFTVPYETHSQGTSLAIAQDNNVIFCPDGIATSDARKSTHYGIISNVSPGRSAWENYPAKSVFLESTYRFTENK